jgi:hypothetical protein
MQQFSSLLSWRLFTAQHISGALPPIIRSSTTAVAACSFTAVIELLIMAGKTSEICWAVNKRQDNKLKNCCIWLVIYLNFTMMYGLTILKFKINGVEFPVSNHSCLQMNCVRYPQCFSKYNKHKAIILYVPALYGTNIIIRDTRQNSSTSL